MSRTSSEDSVKDRQYPRITVVIPWIGRQEYIKATVEALRRQDYPNLEIMISDNSLSESIETLLPDLSDPKIKLLLRNEKRLSSADHFTACIKDAGGEYVMIMSDDDLIEPRYVSGMLDAFKSNPASAVVLGEQIVISDSFADAPKDSGESTVNHFHGARFFLGRLLNPRKYPIVTYVSLFARRADMLLFPYRDYPDGSNADNFMMLCLASRGDVGISSRKMYYRVYENSSGLKTQFSRLLTSCAMYDRDVVAFMAAHSHTFRAPMRLAFRVLIRFRNGSMMLRRLCTLYRQRMSKREFIVSACSVVLYLIGFSQASMSILAGIQQTR